MLPDKGIADFALRYLGALLAKYEKLFFRFSGNAGLFVNTS